MSMMKQAFDNWIESDAAATMVYLTEAGAMTNEDLRKVFEAGWNAARAEARSDASQPTGGRHPGDLREPLTPDPPYTDRREDGSPIMVDARQKYHDRDDR